MPYKLRQNQNHKFKKATYKIKNWPEYNAALEKRGSVKLWFSDEVIKSWYANKIKNKDRGRQNKYSDLAIQAALCIKVQFKLTYRSVTGFLNSLINVMDLSLDIPHYSRICRRARILDLPKLIRKSYGENINIVIDSTGLKVYGAGQWHEEKHNIIKKRTWRKFHIVVDKDTHEIIAQELTTNVDSDDSQVPKLLTQINEGLNHVSADGAYDTDSVYESIEKNSNNKNVTIAIPPRKHAALSCFYETDPTARDKNILFVEEHGRHKWQDYSDYNYRSIAENAMMRYQTLIGGKLYSRTLESQKIESRIGCLVINKFTRIGMPKSQKIKKLS
jgi:hypothetical protein